MSCSSKALCSDLLLTFCVGRTSWPVLSADLNPIEHCWDYLKKWIKKSGLDTAYQLRNALRREWRRVPMSYIRNLARSMRARCNVVVAANGGHTRFK